VLEHDLTVVGPVKAILCVQSSAPDTDFVVRLCDVWPGGRSMSVCDGILRARYRTSYTEPELMVPGEVYRVEVDLWATAQVFAAGHRLRVEVASSDFPRFARNLNTGGALANEVHGRVAHNTIFHDRTRPSHIVLPVLN
jgi:putative CocE/NonD family hydrolase